MPEISRFYGIIIRMFWDDHNPPHFHAAYGDDEVLVDINSLSIFAGKLSPRAQSLVIEWATIHQRELLDDWTLACKQKSLAKITPLP